MATYAIGDVQGCLDELHRLLERIGFDPAQDRLWFVGDLVNRGPKSLETLRYVRALGGSAVTVLGNHDLHLLALAQGNGRPRKRGSGLEGVLDAPDRADLLDWLRHRPLLHHDSALNVAMVHAGLPPQWDLALAARCARELEAVLQGPDQEAFFRNMYGNQPNRWHPGLTGWDRLRFITNAFTRTRYVNADGKLKLKPTGPPESVDDGLVPWFAAPGRASRGERIVFGHWSTLGFRVHEDTYAIDTGCVWGGRLTALRLDDMQPFHVPCPKAADPFAP